MLDHQDPQFAEEPKPMWKLADTDHKTGSVLVSKDSSLVEVIVPDMEFGHQIITIDSENLLRVWDVKKQVTIESYRLPLEGRVT